MTDLTLFKNETLGEIRAMEIDGEPWFVGKDIAVALGYTNSRKAIADHVDEEDKTDGVTIRDSIGREQTPTLINESGLYSLILSSKLPTAKQFKKWVTSEVIPSIRKNGAYIAGQNDMDDNELIARALLATKRIIEAKDKQIAEQTQRIAMQTETISAQQDTITELIPKGIFADAVSSSKSSILIGELAKLLKQNKIEMGQNRLFEWMRKNGFLMKQGSSYNLPTQRAMEQGLFEIKESTIVNSDGSIRTTKTPKVTGKGQVYFVDRIIKEHSDLYAI